MIYKRKKVIQDSKDINKNIFGFNVTLKSLQLHQDITLLGYT